MGQRLLMGSKAHGPWSRHVRLRGLTMGLLRTRSLSTAILDKRLELWQVEWDRRQSLHNPRNSTTVEAHSEPTGVFQCGDHTVPGEVRSTTPLDIARNISKSFSKRAMLARWNGSWWDLTRPLPDQGQVEFFGWDGPLVPPETGSLGKGDQRSRLSVNPAELTDARSVFWHSSAHLLGAAIERLYGDRILLCNGPSIPEKGFYYDFYLCRESTTLPSLLPEYVSQDYLLRSPEAEEQSKYTTEPSCIPQVNLTDLLEEGRGYTFLPETDKEQIQSIVSKLARENHPFQRMDLTHHQARQLFAYNPFKLHYISRIPDSETLTVYRCGHFIDLCSGPHLPTTGMIQAHQITKFASAHWLAAMETPLASHSAGSSGVETVVQRPFLNRVYGITFPTSKQLKEWERAQAEAARRDHRVIGKDQKLFTFDTELSPGSVFFLPHGTRIVQRLLTMLRDLYREFGFTEVMTPLIYKQSLWETSGHWQNYADDMFLVTDRQQLETATYSSHPDHPDGVDSAGLLSPEYQSGCCTQHNISHGEELFGLKPMNCPGHCLLFAEHPRSYKELPMRLADFSPLHRNEARGALSGLTRVRKFHQDDGHIFCAPEDIGQEISHCLTMLHRVYGLLGFSNYELTLSTRPEDKFIGSLDEWTRAEQALEEALNSTGQHWQVKPGDGAFYGPKIDVMVRDALGRSHQTATIQLDFQLPQRFHLRYQNETSTYDTPVIIHRAILGSVERMLAILIEHYAGKWPFWLSPRQAMVIPVGGTKFLPYAQQVQRWLANPASYSESVDSSSVGDSHSGNVHHHLSETEAGTPKSLAGFRAYPGEFYYVDMDDQTKSLNKMIREAQLSRYNFILVVGEKEAHTRTVNVRMRDGTMLGTKSIPEVLAQFRNLQCSYQ
ncbi:hypothetical protein IWQ62_004507 [Dispira parvispora]|uniref:threonine--tRNA ligase n=1 Tax=Dispira parvispora TaxID=1520584 RepID=A0A9W8E0K9_9FUNG|nr:hypothetical protein IWQ62_004507 [Dispira parvispora]